MKYIEINSSKISSEEWDKIYEILDQAQPDDIGEEIIGDKRLVFEGFSPDCWSEMEEENKGIDDIEDELLEEWKKSGWDLIESDWMGDRLFYAIYE